MNNELLTQLVCNDTLQYFSPSTSQPRGDDGTTLGPGNGTFLLPSTTMWFSSCYRRERTMKVTKALLLKKILPKQKSTPQFALWNDCILVNNNVKSHADIVPMGQWGILSKYHLEDFVF